MGRKGLECTPGDRGDSKSGLSAIKGTKPASMPSMLKSELSKGYESPGTGWHGNVKR